MPHSFIQELSFTDLEEAINMLFSILKKLFHLSRDPTEKSHFPRNMPLTLIVLCTCLGYSLS